MAKRVVLNCLAFLLASAYVVMLGTDFQSAAIKVIPIALVLVLVAAFVQARFQRSRLRAKKR